MASEKAQIGAQSNGMQNEIRAAFGQVNVENDTSTQREPVPRITASFNGKFVEVPLNGKWWRSFADFVEKMAEAMEGVDLQNSTINDDVEYAKDMMAKFRAKE